MIARWWYDPASKKALVSAGVAAVVVYVVGDVASGVSYDGYSFRDQAISELSAFGSPVRPVMVTVILVHNVLLLVFGIGLLRAARRRSVRWIGGLLVAEFAVVGIPTHTFWAMSSRDRPKGFNDIMHIAMSAVFSVLVVGMMALSAVAYRGRFRRLTVAAIATVVGFGAASSVAIRGIERNETRGAGAFERVNAYAYFAWLVALAVKVIRDELRRA